MITPELIDSVKTHEGYRSKAYTDTEGIWTVGYGQNLQVLEIDEALAEEWLMRELHVVANELSEDISFRALNPVRQGVLIEMGYNLGIAGLKLFRNMWAAIKTGDWAEAKAQGLDSKWATQVGQRANTLMDRLESGEW